MCVACVAEGVTYVGGSVVALRIMAVRARARAGRPTAPVAESPDAGDDAPRSPGTQAPSPEVLGRP